MIRVNSRNAALSSAEQVFLRNQYCCSASIRSASSRRVSVRASASVSLLNLLIGQASSCQVTPSPVANPILERPAARSPWVYNGPVANWAHSPASACADCRPCRSARSNARPWFMALPITWAGARPVPVCSRPSP